MEEPNMKELKEKTTPYMTKIKIAINALKSKDYELALISIKQAGLENQNLPEYHNLLGVIAEHHDDFSLACKHYRAAYALDPSYKPALNNLDRITNFYCGHSENKPDLGENFELEVISPSLFLFDLLNPRHKKKYK
jgi:Tfp pilus assembly protein PilF